MKFKSIIACGLLLLGVGAATTSCEDMFTAENKLVTTDLAPKDTLYQVMGIVQRMQKLADRTVLLGEVRADLVEVDPIHASADIQELAANNVSTTNAYNRPADYYAVINNCNIYLAHVDSMRYGQGTDRYFEKEVCAVKCFRAWCYLELLKIYGEVPFVTEPVVTSDAAEAIVASGKKSGMDEILSFLINDLAKYPYMDDNNDLSQSYGNQSYAGIRYDKMFIPVRALLGELYLWRGSYTQNQSDYINAIRMYHNYFTFTNEEVSTGNSAAIWNDRNFNRENANAYNDNFKSANDCAGVLPLDTTTYFGNVTDLRAVFNSQYSNDYYPAVSPSERIKKISKSQDYCFYYFDSATGKGQPIPGSHNENDYKEKIQEGDLRLYAVYNTESNFKESQYNSNVSPTKTFITKYTSGNKSMNNDVHQSYIPYFRKNTLYLHLAEALNLAGFPETAFAILKYGMSYYTLKDYVSEDEFNRLCAIQSYGFTRQENLYTGDMLTKTTGTFVIWPSSTFTTQDVTSNSARTWQGGNEIRHRQIGIHAFGCGDVEYDDKYDVNTEEVNKFIKDNFTPADTIELEPLNPGSSAEDSLLYEEGLFMNAVIKAANEELANQKAAYLLTPELRAVRQAHVANLILEEEALEGMFEGLRFYDIMRYQMQNGKVTGTSATITMPACITDKYGDTPSMTGKPWYLTLPKR